MKLLYGIFTTALLCCPLPGMALDLPALLPVMEKQPPARVALGKMLFFDRRLSGDGTMSCAVCHIPDTAFSDGRPISGAYPTHRHWRNTPGLLNVAYLKSLFWDGRTGSLEEQAKGPIESPFEMNGDLDFVAAELNEVDAYRKQFQEIFGGEVTSERILAAIAAFERTLLVNDSPFDRFLAGEQDALNDIQKRGMKIFFGPRGGCSLCHAGPLLSDGKFHRLGLPQPEVLTSDPQHRATRRFVLASHGLPMQDEDPGRYLVTKSRVDQGCFRTPPLRQVAATGPYMHNGAFKTLAEVVAFFSAGGGDRPDQSEKLRRLDLSAAEQGALTAFLKSLSGTVPEVRRPHLPGD